MLIIIPTLNSKRQNLNSAYTACHSAYENQNAHARARTLFAVSGSTQFAFHTG
jgi:hypothetical protein